MLAEQIVERRALIARNLINGVPEDQVARDLHCTVADVRSEWEYVADKLQSYMLERNWPNTDVSTVERAQAQRLLVLHVLERVNLKRPAKLKLRGIETATKEWCDERGLFA